MTSRQRPIAAVLAVAAAAGAAWLVRAPMRITLVNATLRIDDPWMRAAGLALAAAAAVLVALALPPRRASRILLGGCAAALAVLAVGAATTWLEARPDAIAAGRYFARTALPWTAVTRVEARQDGITVWGVSGSAIDFDAARLTGDQRAVLDRTVARRVREAGGQRALTSK